MLKDLGKSVFIYGIASSISKFVGIFLIPIFSRYFSPEQYGSLDLISTVISFVAILGMLQLESAISRYYYEAEGRNRNVYISTAFWTILILSALLLILIILLSDVISFKIFDTLQYSSLIKFASLNIILLNLFGYLTVLLRFQNKPILYSIVIFLQFIITFLISVVLVYYNKGIISFFIGQAAGLLTGIVVIIIYLRKSFVFTIDKKVLKDFFNYSLPQVPAVAGNWMNSYVNRFVMLSSLTIADIGIYTVALKIASIFNLLENAFRMAWEPYLWSKIKIPGHKELLRTLSISISIIIFSFALLFMLFSKEALLLLSTKEYIDALPVIKILIFAFSFPILTQVFGIGTSVAKKTIYNTISFFGGVVINLSMLFILVPHIGLIGVPLSLCISNLTILFLMWYFSEKKYFIGFNYRIEIIIILIFSLFAYLLFIFEIHLFIRIVVFLIAFLTLFFNKQKIYSFVTKTL